MTVKVKIRFQRKISPGKCLLFLRLQGPGGSDSSAMLPQTVRNANVDVIILVLDPERKARPECPPGIGGGRVAHAARGSAPTTGPGKSSPVRE